MVVGRSVHRSLQSVDDLPIQPADDRKPLVAVVEVIDVGIIFGIQRRGVVTVRRGHAVRHVAFHGRRGRECARDGIHLVVELFAPGIRIIGRSTHPEAFRNVGIQADARVETVVARTQRHAVVLGIAHAGRIGGLLRTAVDTHVVILPPVVAEKHVLPVVILENQPLGVVQRVAHLLVAGRHGLALFEPAGRVDRISVVDRTCRESGCKVVHGTRALGDRGTHDADVILGAEQVETTLRLLETDIGVERHAGTRIALARLGCNEHYAVRTARTVNGRRGGVLEHLHRLDVVGVDARKSALHAVHQDQRVVIAVDRRAAADTDHGVCAGRVVAAVNTRTGDLALQRLAERIDRRALYQIAVDFGHGRSDRTARLRTVAHHDYFVHTHRGLRHDDVHDGPVAHLYALGFETEEEKHERRSLRRFDRVFAVAVGRRTRRGILDDNRHARQFFTRIVLHHALQGYVLR